MYCIYQTHFMVAGLWCPDLFQGFLLDDTSVNCNKRLLQLTWLLILWPARDKTQIENGYYEYRYLWRREYQLSHKLYQYVYIAPVRQLGLAISNVRCARHFSLPLMSWVYFNSSPPNAPYMRRWTESALVQIMAYHLFGAKPLPEPTLAYCQLDP